jgi:hypothetical protein
MEALPVPEALDNVIQAPDFVAVQVQYCPVVSAMAYVPPAGGAAWLVEPTV